MKITLIQPAMMKSARFRGRRTWDFQPLTLARLAALTPPDVEVEVLDDRLEVIDYDAPRDLVGITAQTFMARRAYQIAAQFRQRGTPVIMGGHHPALLPEEASQHADSILIGEAEDLWPQVVEEARQGRLRPVYRQAGTVTFVNAPCDRRPLAGKRYLPVTLVEATRGCPFNCSYCSVTKFFGGQFRHRPVAEVVQEIEANPNIGYMFTDDNIVGEREYAKALFQALIPLKVRWFGQASLTVARDPELLDLMQRSGCLGLLIGLESNSPESLAQMDKSWNTVGLGYAQALGVLRDHGLPVVGSFIVGMDGDTLESLDELVEFTIEQRLFAVLFNILFPYPGTRLYAQLEAAGRLLYPHWWLDPGYRYGYPAYRPLNLEPAALAEQRMRMYRRFYGPGAFLHRLWDRQANGRDLAGILLYLGMNLPSYRDVRRSFGESLGENE